MIAIKFDESRSGRFVSDLVRRHESGWWEIYYDGLWYVAKVYGDQTNIANVLCRQAGYDGVDQVGSYNCE